MTGVSCADVRTYLSGVQGGAPPAADPALFDTLRTHGAIDGTPSAPALTAVGQHVLAELNVRAYRVDALPLELVAAHLDRILGDLDHVAKTAEYFLAELGPVTPPEALALLRPVAVSLANRRETPDELAEEFRNAWGSVEVMGGAAEDRLLAAELLCASSAEMETVYAPMNITVSWVRQRAGANVPAVGVAAILHLIPKPDGTPSLEEYLSLRSVAGGEEAAALLASATGAPSASLERRDRFLAEIAAMGLPDGADAKLAAAYLVAAGVEPVATLNRLKSIATDLGEDYPHPVTPAAVLATVNAIAPAELLNWLDKARQTAQSRKLAPTPKELAALAVSLVHGLPPGEFSTGLDSRGPPPVSIPALVALHAWVYRPLVSRSASGDATRVAPPAS